MHGGGSRSFPSRGAMDVGLILAGMIMTLVGVATSAELFLGGLAVALLGLLIYLRRRGNVGRPISWWKLFLGYAIIGTLVRIWFRSTW